MMIKLQISHLVFICIWNDDGAVQRPCSISSTAYFIPVQRRDGVACQAGQRTAGDEATLSLPVEVSCCNRTETAGGERVKGRGGGAGGMVQGMSGMS